MRSYIEELCHAKRHARALGAFNVFNGLSVRAVIAAAAALDTPVILQTSVPTVRQFGVERLGAMLSLMIRDAPVHVMIHLDHCRDIDLAKACVDAGWHSVMYDGSLLPLEENIANCRIVADYAHAKGVQVEGELGHIAGTEDSLSVAEEDAADADLEASIRLVRESGIDSLAPAIGTVHGTYRGEPHINFPLVEQLAAALDVPLVIHGGTGLSGAVFARLIQNGAAKVNVATALRHAYFSGIQAYLSANPGREDPAALDQFLSSRIQAAAAEHMRMFQASARP